MDDDDKQGSRGIPSRTKIGKRASFLEKFPAMCEPLKLFGGLVHIPFWGLRNISCAMADIMISDLPHIEYDTKDHISKSDVDDAIKRTKELQNYTAKNGLGINMKNTVSLSSIIAKEHTPKTNMTIQQAKSMAAKYKNSRLH